MYWNITRPYIKYFNLNRKVSNGINNNDRGLYYISITYYVL